MQKDYDIEIAAGAAQKPTEEAYNVSVTNNTLEIRLVFAGKGTTRIPKRGVYGPLISSISVVSGEAENFPYIIWPDNFHSLMLSCIKYEAINRHNTLVLQPLI